MNSSRLILFFSRGTSLAIWRDTGLLERELAPYHQLVPHLDAIALVTYGADEDAPFVSELNTFEVLHNRWNLPTDLFSLLVPLLYQGQMRNAAIFKTNQINGWWAAGLAKFLYHKPLLVRCGYLLSLDQERKGYGRVHLYLVSLLERWAFQYADAVIVTTSQMKQEAIRRYGSPPAKIVVIPNSINVNVFRPLLEIEPLPGRIGFVGRFSPEKNLPLLLEAVSGIEGASLLLIGDGELRPKLEAQASRTGVEVEFCGKVPNYRLPGLLNTCQALVLPSQWEGMPKALLEAMSCGLPVIGTDVPGIRDIIEHDQTGYLCKPTVADLRSAIRTILADASLRHRLGAQARHFVEQHHALEQTVAQELKLLSTLVRQ